MKLMRNDCSPVYNFSAHLALPGEFFILSRMPEYCVFVGKYSKTDIIDFNSLPSGVTVFRGNVGDSCVYSLIAGAPGMYIMNMNISRERMDKLTREWLADRFVAVLRSLGYDVYVDPYSRGNDILYQGKKVCGFALEKDDQYYYVNAFFQCTIDDKFMEILNCIHYPNWKLKDKGAMERIGCLDGLSERFDDVYDAIRHNWGFEFEEANDVTWEIDNSLIIFPR